MDISVRIAGDDDVGVLAGLRRAWNEENAGGPIDDPGFEARFGAWVAAERATRTFFLVYLGDAPVGMANVKRYDRMPVAGRSSAGRWGYVGNVFVLAEHRNASIGQALMDELIAWAGQQGLVHLRLAPSPLSQSFYERLGFVPGAVVELDPPPDVAAQGRKVPRVPQQPMRRSAGGGGRRWTLASARWSGSASARARRRSPVRSTSLSGPSCQRFVQSAMCGWTRRAAASWNARSGAGSPDSVASPELVERRHREIAAGAGGVARAEGGALVLGEDRGRRVGLGWSPGPRAGR